MFEKPLNTTLKFSIVGSSTENVDIIKKAFGELPIRLVLHEVYKSVNIFIATNIPSSEAVDFIALDKSMFIELEEKEQLVTAPLLVFTNAFEAIDAVHNFVLGSIPIPVASNKLLASMNKLSTIKKHFEKNSSGFNLTTTDSIDSTRTFLIKKGRDFQLINTDSISIFYTDNKLTFAYDEKGNKFILQYSLIELENQLNSRVFFRANRQSLINRKFINKIKQLDEGRYEIIIDAVDALRIDINQQKFSRLREWIENH